MRWIDTSTDEDAAKVHFGMWDTVWRKEDDGSLVGASSGPMEGDEFWYQALEKVKHLPDKRIEIASGSLPINAAWREIATGLRAKIRESRKAKADYDADLRALHHLAALHSFGFSEVRGRGYDFMALIPYQRLAALDLSYDLLGCNELPLLGVNDRKWMIEKWGEANQHTTAMVVYHELYQSEQARVSALEERHRKESHDRALMQLDDLMDDDRPDAPSRPAPASKTGFLRGLLRGLFA